METDKINRTRISCSVGAPAAGSSSPTVAVVRLCCPLLSQMEAAAFLSKQTHMNVKHHHHHQNTFCHFLNWREEPLLPLFCFFFFLQHFFFCFVIIVETNHLNKRRRHQCTAHFSRQLIRHITIVQITLPLVHFRFSATHVV